MDEIDEPATNEHMRKNPMHEGTHSIIIASVRHDHRRQHEVCIVGIYTQVVWQVGRCK
jgi:hypothetical protein